MSLERIAFLEGTWRGTGRGVYPTIEGFDYTEEITFSSVPGKPFLAYAQKTMVGGSPAHAETGYLRSPAEGVVELVVAMPTGVVEVHSGSLSDGTLELRSTVVGLTPTAKQVSSVTRHITVAGEVLTYQLDMAAVGQEEQIHLSAELHRSG